MIGEEMNGRVNSDNMLRTRQVAELLNVHINTVRRWSSEGIIKSYRIGPRRDRRFRREDVVRYLENSTQTITILQ